MQTKRLFLVDGSALAYRAHYALSDHTLTNSRGVLTGAVFGFVNSLLGLLEQERPEAIAVVFDASGPTFRHELLEKYKAKRKAMPEELVEQMPVIRHFVRALGMTLLREQGVEADDVIGTLARRAEVSGMQTWIVSPDKDFAQLVTEQVTLLRPKHRGKGYNVMDQAGVQERFGVKPTQFIDYLALVGDTSDGFDGVKGIGEKTATALLNQFGSLDQVYAQIEEVKPAGTKKKLEEQHEGAMLSRQLATIVTDVEIDFTPEALLWSSIDSQETYRLCADLEFPSLWKRLRKWSAEDQQDVEIQAFYEPAPELEITLVKDRSGLEAAVKQAAQAERLFWHWFMPDPEHSERG
ncbi:MAG: 5'-3' exonuclease H3TH domain-containing protein, partial [Myxococcota bacterium]